MSNEEKILELLAKHEYTFQEIRQALTESARARIHSPDDAYGFTNLQKKF